MSQERVAQISQDQSEQLSQSQIERTRAWTSLLAVVVGDVAIALIAVWTMLSIGNNGSLDAAILTSAFTAVTAATTAYFGIKATANTAHSALTRNESDGAKGAPR
jgi:hypothetical protein